MTQSNHKLSKLRSKDLNVSAININSITAPDRLQELQHFVDLNDISILALSEMKVDVEVHPSLYYLKGFHEPVTKFRTRKGGGVAIYVRNKIPFSRITELESDYFEALWVKVKTQKAVTVLCSCYLPPHTTADRQADFLDYLADSVSEAKKYSPDIITVVGDCNAGNCWLPSDAPHHSPVSSFELNLKAATEALSLTQLIKTATRIQNGTHNLRDVAFVDRPDIIKASGVAPTFSKLDHLPLLITLTLQTSHGSVQPRSNTWDYEKTDTDGLVSALSRVNWNGIADNDVEEGIELLTSAIFQAATACIPTKTVKQRNDKPWLSCELKREMRKRDRLFRAAQYQNSEVGWTRWRNQRNLVTSLNRRLKSEHIRRKVELLIENKKSPYKYHQILKSITGFKRKETLPPLIVNSTILSDDVSKAEALNTYFSSQTNISINNRNMEFLQKYRSNHVKTSKVFIFNEITRDEVISTINSMDSSKASGPDNIPTKLIKMTAAFIAEPLSKLLNKSVQQGKFPTQWKRARVTPVFKGKGSPSDPESYRPISLLSCLSKIFEKLMFARIYNHIDCNALLSPKQSGYRPGHNTELQLTYINDRLYRALDAGDDYSIIYLDISRYFEKIWHEGLLAKCDTEFGIRGKHLDWLSSYLSDRSQKVKVGETESGQRRLVAGVPQGSVLGPLLAIMYLNGLSEVTHNEMLFFADDSSIHARHNRINFDEVQRSLQHDLDAISEYAHDWIITFNAAKTTQQTFTHKPEPKIPTLNFDGSRVPHRDSHKHLGATM